MKTEPIGCGDHGCEFYKPKGVGTNGGCRCLKHIQPTSERIEVSQKVRNLQQRLQEAEQRSTWVRTEDQQPPEGVMVLAELGLEYVIGERHGEEFEIPNWTTKITSIGYWMPLPVIPEPYNG